VKKIIPTLFIIFSVSVSWAQKKKMLNNDTYDNKPLHFGFTLSINSMQYRIEHSGDLLTQNDTIFGVEAKKEPGFGLGLLTDLKLNKYFNIRLEPGLQLGERQLIYKVRNLNANKNVYQFTEEVKKIPSIYVDFPILLKLRAKRINNYRPYLIGGFSIKYDYETRRKNEKNAGYTPKSHPLQYYYELGFGIDYYMPFFKFSTELKFCQGINDILVHENVEYVNAIDKLMSRLVVFSLHFE